MAAPEETMLKASFKRILSFWTGVDSLTLDGRIHRLRRPTPADDARRLASDWRLVGDDIRKAMRDEQACGHGEA